MVAVPVDTRPQICQALFTIIANNYDYSRKTKCVKFYLALLDKLGISREEYGKMEDFSTNNADTVLNTNNADTVPVLQAKL